jgi:hypothetical protein
MEINVFKLKSSYNTFKAYMYNAFLNAGFSVVFENNALGILALNDFVKMINVLYHTHIIKQLSFKPKEYHNF